MGFLSSLCTGLKNIVSAISKVLQNSDLMQKLVPQLMETIPPPYDVIAVVAIIAISAAMGVEENPDELGWQMQQSDKKPENFASFREYKEYLDKEHPFDQEKFNELTADEKAACRYVGMAGTMAELREAKGFEITPAALGVLAGGAASLKWDNKTIGDFVKGMSSYLAGAGETSMGIVADLARGKLDPDKYDVAMGGVDAGVKATGTKQDRAVVVESLRESVSTNENI